MVLHVSIVRINENVQCHKNPALRMNRLVNRECSYAGEISMHQQINTNYFLVLFCTNFRWMKSICIAEQELRL